MDITNEEIKRVPQVLGNKTFENVTANIAKPAETKAPKWWFIGLIGSASLAAILFSMIGYLVWDGVGVWGLNNPVGWGFAIVNFVFCCCHCSLPYLTFVRFTITHYSVYSLIFFV